MIGHTLSQPFFAEGHDGSVDGYRITCSCGWEASTSLSALEVRRYGVQHLDFMARRKDTPRSSRKG